MTPRQKRLSAVVLVLVGVSVASLLALRSFRDSVLYYYTPTQLAAGRVPANARSASAAWSARAASCASPAASRCASRSRTSPAASTVHYTGVLPDLFRDGQGVVVHGTLVNGEFLADEVLAKHDEKYMPPNMAGKVPPPAGVPK